MVIVHVWDSAWRRYAKGMKAGSPGHAALQLNPQALTAEAGYVSLHPGPLGIGQGRTLKTLREDVAHYESTNQEHWTQELEDLEVDAMISHWKEFQKSSTPYSTKNFCSSIVHDLLVLGGADRFASGWGSWVIFGTWSPADIQDYSESVARGIIRQRQQRRATGGKRG